jgi:hypothetical protein
MHINMKLWIYKEILAKKSIQFKILSSKNEITQAKRSMTL